MGKRQESDYRPMVVVQDIHGGSTVMPFERGVVEHIREANERLEYFDSLVADVSESVAMVFDRVDALAEQLGLEWVSESTVKAHFAKKPSPTLAEAGE